MPLSGVEMREFGNMVNQLFPGVGWCVFTFSLESTGIGNYISNGEREDMIIALREMADHLEKGKTFPTPEKN